MCDSTLWQSQIPVLKKKFIVSVPSLKNYKSINESVKKIAHKNNKKLSIIGFSMGGFIAIKLAIDFPDMVDKLVLVGTNARDVSKKRKILLEKSLNILNEKNYAKLFFKKNYSLYFSDKNLQNKSLQNIVYSMAKKLGYQSFLNQTNLILKRPNQLKNLNQIKSKTLIIRGAEDKLSTAMMNKQLNKKIKNSKYKEVKNSSHFLMLEKPDTFNNIVSNFLY